MPDPGSNQSFPLRSQRMAMLVIHGIGEQNPYETLDAFARGIFTCLKERLGLNLELSPLEIALKDWTQVGMRIRIRPDGAAPQQGIFDLFEFYWAPETEDKLSWKDTLTWLIRTDLTPLRYFADNLQQIIRASNQPQASALWEAIKVYAREILRIVLLYIPLAAVLLWLLTWMLHPRNIWQSLQPILAPLDVYTHWPKVLPVVAYFLGILMVWFTIQSASSLLRRRGKTIQGWAELIWFVLAIVSAAVFFVIGNWLSIHFAVDLNPLIAAVFSKAMIFPLVALGFAAFWRYVLTGYAADVAVYVASDAKSKNYAARSAILAGSTAALKRILADPQYDHVVLAGHSLGSVIAYDTINEVLDQFNASSGPASDQPTSMLTLEQLQKLRGLVTFGSPLDKIYYFFREHVNEDQAIRAQILSMLYSFRKIPSGREYGPFKFTYSFPQLDQLRWVNAWSLMDPVSGKLTFYKVDDRKSFWYWIPGYAHLSYWGDPKFYGYLAEQLLCSPEFVRSRQHCQNGEQKKAFRKGATS
jgi:hypothetical protein